ncbi:MAG TPA: hypothetical protein VGB73_04080 [Pyrinomonadaceae bacterium]|jgi:hypothetical protein
MSSEQEQIRSLAERIARRLSENGSDAGGGGERSGADDNHELSTLRAHLAEIQQRLAHLESHIGHDDSCGDDSATKHQPAPTTSVERGAAQRGRTASQASTQAGHTQMPRLSGTYVPAAHPSQERFGIDDAVSELVDFFEREKLCSVEPGEKPCDQCGMCSSRGF